MSVVLEPDNQVLILVALVERFDAKYRRETNLVSPEHLRGPVLELTPRALMF